MAGEVSLTFYSAMLFIVCVWAAVISRQTIVLIRLRLVRVKVFPENRYFPEMLFSGKENIFMCLVAFQKMFRKIFSDVWLCS